MKTKLPEHPAKFARQYPEVWSAFERLADRCHQAGALDAKTRRLVKLGIAIGTGWEGAVHAQVRNAMAEGLTAAEVRHVILLGLTTIGFPASMAALSWANEVLGSPRRGRRSRK